MRTTKLDWIKHILLLAGLMLLLALGMANPFLPGEYDLMAVPISIMIQVFGLAGLPFVPVGILWMMIPKHKYGFAIAALIVGFIVMLILSLFATLSVGRSFGLLTLLACISIAPYLISKLKQLKGQASTNFSWLLYYLICLPVFALILQLALRNPLTKQSRNRAIENADLFISDIEKYHQQHGQYPLTLEAQNKDFKTDVVGIEKYLYAPHKKSYNLSFEQPRFLLDRIGTREWVVYNPLDENTIYSHTVWLLPALHAEPIQGWYDSGDTDHLHWKYFLFD